MTKQEKIEEVYGFLSDLIDENGWAMYGVDEGGEHGVEPFGEYQIRNEKDGYFEWRPLELKGIKDNNGWLKIESEEDLPKKDLICAFYLHTNRLLFGRYIKSIDSFRCDEGDLYHVSVSHYQQIKLPKPPKY